MTEEGALEHLDQLTRTYTPHPYFNGYVYSFEHQSQETRIICRIHAARVIVDAIYQ